MLSEAKDLALSTDNRARFFAALRMTVTCVRSRKRSCAILFSAPVISFRSRITGALKCTLRAFFQRFEFFFQLPHFDDKIRKAS
jgi:hypothetical protein